MIVCPGGGYAGLADHEAGPVAEWLNSFGVAAFVLNYRRTPYRHPIPLGDAQRAIRWVRSHADEWGLDKNHIGILGFSAGGHLAASAATLFDDGRPEALDPVERESSRPDAAILCYPVISCGEFAHRGSVLNLLGDPPPLEKVRELSLETRVTPRNPPTFIWHTADDGAVPVENSLLFAGALAQHEVNTTLHVFPHGQHGLGLASDSATVSVWTGRCAHWLKDMGF